MKARKEAKKALMVREGEKMVLVVGNAEDLRRLSRELHELPQSPLVTTDPPVVDYGFPLDAKDRRM